MQNSGEQTASANCRCRRMESGYRKGSALRTRWSISCQILAMFGWSSMVLQVGSWEYSVSCWSIYNPLQSTSLHALYSTHLQHPLSCFISVPFSVHRLISALCSTTIPQEEIFPQFLFSHSFRIMSRSCLKKRKHTKTSHQPANQKTPNLYIMWLTDTSGDACFVWANLINEFIICFRCLASGGLLSKAVSAGLAALRWWHWQCSVTLFTFPLTSFSLINWGHNLPLHQDMGIYNIPNLLLLTLTIFSAFWT